MRQNHEVMMTRVINAKGEFELEKYEWRKEIPEKAIALCPRKDCPGVVFMDGSRDYLVKSVDCDCCDYEGEVPLGTLYKNLKEVCPELNLYPNGGKVLVLITGEHPQISTASLTVSELIEKLKNYPPDAKLVIWNGSFVGIAGALPTADAKRVELLQMDIE